MRKTAIAVAVLALSCIQAHATNYPFVFAPSEGLYSKYEKAYREEICLNGYWDFIPMELPQDYGPGGGYAPELPYPEGQKADKTKIKIPSPWNVNSFCNEDLFGPDHRNYPSYPAYWDGVKMAWMSREISIPKDWDGKQIGLHFEAVAGQSVVYLDREKIGENFDLFLPFECDITEYVKPGETYRLLVGVRSQSLFEDRSTVGRRVVPAGSMWGTHINGIWQDVFLTAVPKVCIEDVFVKTLVAQNKIEAEIRVKNNSLKIAKFTLCGQIREWVNLAGTDINSAPLPAWKLGNEDIAKTEEASLRLNPGEAKTIRLCAYLSEDTLEKWSPEHPNLYGLLVGLYRGKHQEDLKYTRFGYREWTIEGDKYCLNGEPFALRGDSWHFMGIPQMTRRYAYSWYKAIKDMNGNAVRPHAQVYPRFYLDLADEMGICVLDETGNWASDGGPKLDSDFFWEISKDHLARLVRRDRNHPSVFGWSVSNENKPVINYVFGRPDLMPLQEKAWKDWVEIVRSNDPTRPWISSDGEEDGEGILPVTVGHYGDEGSMRSWKALGKPWGVGEHSMAYYGTPAQVSKYNGERAYESQEGRMEGLANECYNLLASERNAGASYSTVFNMVWYALKPLPLGKNDLTKKSSLEDGIFFPEYIEGVPGVQPERMGPYCTTLNPGYDPSLPLYDPWPLFYAMKAANAPQAPAWSPWKDSPKDAATKDAATPTLVPKAEYNSVLYFGSDKLKNTLQSVGVAFCDKPSGKTLVIVDGSCDEPLEQIAALDADLLIWGLEPGSNAAELSDLEVELVPLKRSSFIPEKKSWMLGLGNSDFYFCEVQKADAARYSLGGELGQNSEVLLRSCRTDWRSWNGRAEALKTAAVLRSEYECPEQTAVLVKYGNTYISTLSDFTNSELGYNTLKKMLLGIGVDLQENVVQADEVFFTRDGRTYIPKAAIKGNCAEFFVYSPRRLDDLLIEPDMPQLSLNIKSKNVELLLDGKAITPARIDRERAEYRRLPLLQGWNHIQINAKGRINESDSYFSCPNKGEFLSLLEYSIKQH